MAGQRSDVTLDQARPFIEAHLRGDAATVARLLEEMPALESFPPRHGTWLHESAAAGSVPLVEFWLARGLDADLNLPDSDPSEGRWTPLHVAKNADVVRLLVARGADVNAWTRHHGTPLHYAALSRDAGRLRALLDAGADVSIADADGRTPLAIAIKYKQRETERLLRSLGAPLEGTPPAGRAVRTPPVIDLRKDLARIKKMIVDAVKKFAREHPAEPVTAVALAASGIEGYVSVGIDTGEFQGSPWDVTYHEYAQATFPAWQEAYELIEQGVKLMTIDGVPFEYGSGRKRGDAYFQTPFYEACLAALRALEQSRELNNLNRVAGFTIGVEISSGDHASFWQPA